MRTSTLKHLKVSAVVGVIFGIILTMPNFKNATMLMNVGRFFYGFFLIGGTFFLTSVLMGKRGKGTANLRIYAQKLSNRGELIDDDYADMIVPFEKKPTKGWLYLTDKFVIFASNPDPEVLEKKAIKMPLSKISSVERFKPTSLTNDGLRIKLPKNQYEIMVGKTDRWIKEIEEGIKKRQHKK